MQTVSTVSSRVRISIARKPLKRLESVRGQLDHRAEATVRMREVLELCEGSEMGQRRRARELNPANANGQKMLEKLQ